MLSTYFKYQIKSTNFQNRVKNIIQNLNTKKVVIYGCGKEYQELNKIFKLEEQLNIIAYSDTKFEKPEQINGIIALPPSEMKKIDSDIILITQENASNTVEYLEKTLCINKEKLIQIFEQEFRDEATNFNYLNDYNFEKYLNKLNKKLKNKKIIIYGAGLLFQVINKYYDLKNLNIIAISDMRFLEHQQNEEFIGYKVCSPVEISELRPDYVLVATKVYIDVAESIKAIINNDKIKIRPLIKKPLKEILKEILD